MFKKFKKLSSGIIFTGGLVAFLVLLAVILLFQTSDVLDKQVVNKDSLVAGGSTENLQEESPEFPNNTVVLGILVDPFPFTTMLRDWRNAFQAFEPAKISFTQKWQACYKLEFLKRYENETAKENARTDSLLNLAMERQVLETKKAWLQSSLITVEALSRMLSDGAEKLSDITKASDLFNDSYIILPLGDFVKKPIGGATLSTKCAAISNGSREEKGRDRAQTLEAGSFGKFNTKFASGEIYELCGASQKEYINSKFNLFSGIFNDNKIDTLEAARLLVMWKGALGIPGSFENFLIVPTSSFFKYFSGEKEAVNDCLISATINESEDWVVKKADGTIDDNELVMGLAMGWKEESFSSVLVVSKDQKVLDMMKKELSGKISDRQDDLRKIIRKTNAEIVSLDSKIAVIVEKIRVIQMEQ
ncbi:MAG TPA: hypothetical protein VJC04_04015 [Candidatus Paceibacterota bacterium]